MIKIYDDKTKFLRNKNFDVKMPLSSEDEATLLEMRDYLINSQDEDYCSKHKIKSGVGLAAPQIGINKRMFVIYYENEDGSVVEYCLVNPKIIKYSAKKCFLSGGEGCLSVETTHEGYVPRYYKITLNAYDVLTKKDISIMASGYESIVLQHEYDHLDGILYYDHINKFDKFNKLDMKEI